MADEQVVTSLAHDLGSCFEQISDKRITKRKEGVSRLLSLLDNEVNLVLIDTFSFGVSPKHLHLAYICDYVSWQAIFSTLCSSVNNDVQKNLDKDKLPDGTVPKAVRDAVNYATSPRSSGHPLPMEPSSATLASHLAHMMEKTLHIRHESSIFNDYSSALKSLLETEEYSRNIACKVWQTLMNLLEKAIQDALDSNKDLEDPSLSSFVSKDLILTKSVLRCVSYDMPPSIHLSLLSIFKSLGHDSLASHPSRIVNDILNVLLQYIIYCKGDYQVELIEVIASYHVTLLGLLRQGDTKGREASIQMYRLALQMQLLSEEQVSDLMAWYGSIDLKELWCEGNDILSFELNSLQSSISSLISSIEIEVKVKGYRSNFRRDVIKRAKSEWRSKTFLSRSIDDPSELGPVACTFLMQHGKYLSRIETLEVLNVLEEKTRLVLSTGFLSEDVNSDIIWMLRIIFVTAYNVVNRSDLDQDDCIPLGRTVDTLARFWHALSRSTIYRDVTLNIIAISLPKISHATLMPNALDIEHDIVLGLPSHGSIEAMISLLRQKTFSSHSYDDNIKIVQWLTSDASMLLDIGLVVSALSTLMLRDCEFRSKLSLKNSDMGNPKWAWWCSTEFDSQIRDLPPVYKWCTLRAASQSASKSEIKNITVQSERYSDLNVYMASKVQMWLQRAASGSHDDCMLPFRISSFAIQLVQNISKFPSINDCWKHGSDFHSCLRKSVERCGEIIRLKAESAEDADRQCLNTYKVFFRSLVSLFNEDKAYQDLLDILFNSIPDLEAALLLSGDLANIKINKQTVAGIYKDDLGGVPKPSQRPLSVSIATVRRMSNVQRQKKYSFLEWYSELWYLLAAQNSTRLYNKAKYMVGFFGSNKFYSPLRVRKAWSKVLWETLVHALEQDVTDSWLDEIQCLLVLDSEKGIFNQGNMLLLQPGIFEFALTSGFETITKLNSNREAITRPYMESIAISIIELIEKATNNETSIRQRICAGEIIVDLLELDKSLLPDYAFDSMVEFVASLVFDDRYAVRIRSCFLFSRILNRFQSPGDLFNAVKEQLPLGMATSEKECFTSSLPEKYFAALLLLGKMAVFVDSLEVTCLAYLVLELSPEIFLPGNEIFLDILQWVATEMGYEDAKQYFSIMAKDIVIHMMTLCPRSGYQNVEKYFLALEVIKIEAGCRNGVEALSGCLVQLRDQNAFMALANLFSIETETLVLRSFPTILALHLHLNEFNGVQDCMQSIESVVHWIRENLVPHAQVMSITDIMITKTLIQLPGIVSFVEERLGSLFTEKLSMIVETLEELQSRDSNKMNAQAIASFKLLTECQALINGYRHPRHKRLALTSLKAIILHIGTQMNHPGLIRYLISILLGLIRVSTTTESAAGLLSYLIGNALGSSKNHTLIDTIGDNIPSIVSQLCQIQGEGLYSDVSNVTLCLEYLTTSAPAELEPFIELIDPVPINKYTKKIMEYVRSKAEEKSCLDYLMRFAERAILMSPSIRHEFIQMMRSLLKKSPYLLLNKTKESSIGSSIGVAAGDPAWKIVLTAENAGDPEMLDFAGELIAHLGPFKPEVLAFNPNQTLYKINFNKELSKGRGRQQSALRRLKEETCFHALLMLHEFISDRNAEVVAASTTILQVMLNTEEGRSAYMMLEGKTKNQLEMFLGSGTLPSNNTGPVTVISKTSLWDLSNSDYETWIRNLGYSVLSTSVNPVIFQSAKLALLKSNYSELLLPLGLTEIVSSSELDEETLSSLSECVGCSLTEHTLPFCKSNPKVLSALLQCFHALRYVYIDALESQNRQKMNYEPQKWPTVYWLQVDYLDLCESCLETKSFISALIFAEEWKSSACNASADDIERFNRIMLEIYTNAPEPDGLYGVSRSNDMRSQLRRFEREGNWGQALVISDIALQLESQTHAHNDDISFPKATNISKVEAINSARRCLANLGAINLLSKMSYANDPRSLNSSPNMALENVVNLGQWFPLDTVGISNSAEIDSQISMAMVSFKSGNIESFKKSLRDIRANIVLDLASAGRETTADLNPLIVKLQMIQTLDEAWDLKVLNSKVSGPLVDGQAGSQMLQEYQNDLESLSGLWQDRESQVSEAWRYSLEIPLKDLRHEILSVIGEKVLQVECLVDMAHSARKSGRYGQSLGALTKLRHSLAMSKHLGEAWGTSYLRPESTWRIEEAKVLWAQCQLDAAVMTIQSLATNTKTRSNNLVQVAYLKTLQAKWMASTQRESSSKIIEILKDASECIETAHNLNKNSLTCRIHFRLASYADHLCREITRKKNSSEWSKAHSILKDKVSQQTELLNKYEEGSKSGTFKVDSKGMPQNMETKYLIRNINRLNADIQEDSKREKEEDDRQNYFERLALKSYFNCLKNGDHYDLPAMFRLVQIWLSHDSYSPRSRDIHGIIHKYMREIPSYKLLPLVYQLASRIDELDSDDSGFQNNLHAMLLIMGLQHPYHTLPILFALLNGDRDRQGQKRALRAASEGGMKFVANAARLEAASSIIHSISLHDRRLKLIVQDMKIATDGYIQLAAVEVDKTTSEIPFPARFKRQICSLNSIPVLSMMLPVDHSLQYEDIPVVASVEEKITFPGGINKPKLVTLCDSHGSKRKQLVKGGNDDLRQDAVMQQFFRMLNAFLLEAQSTASRMLSIRTYNALPFSPASGLLEWVDNTEPFQSFVINGNKMADQTIQSVRGLLAAAIKSKALPEIRATFLDCLKKSPPRMRQVFLHRFPDTSRWYEARLAYTRSVAVNSMAGHIIGLGDRHASNILLDVNTAEVVHIDLGIAFEQGKLLRTPERVPFRLTANIIDGMGVTGVEGVMRRCCEETLRVLRKQKEHLMTVLSVFMHDPLYKWALTIDRVNKTQSDEDIEVPRNLGNQPAPFQGNADANRTLLRIQQKLEGIEGGDSSARGVEGQVQFLLHESTDPNNLYRMYIGWQPFI